MARDTALIKQQMVDAKDAESSLDDLTSTSQVSIWNNFLFIVAQCLNLFEQLIDLFKISFEITAAKSIYGIDSWIRERMFEFQYDATTPQIAVIVDNQITYATVDETKRIISRCAVIRAGVGKVEIRVAKSEPPIQLTTLEADAALSFANSFAPAGIEYFITNKASDKLFIEADVYYDGQYAATIQTTVIDTINAFLANIDFNGVIKVSDIENTIKDVVGVTDVKLTTIKGRQDGTAFASATVVFDLATGVNLLSYSTGSGYIVEETTSGQTFTDKITFIST